MGSIILSTATFAAVLLAHFPIAMACRCAAARPEFLWAAADTVAIVSPDISKPLLCVSAEGPGCNSYNPIFIVKKILKGELVGFTPDRLTIQPENAKLHMLCGSVRDPKSDYVAFLIKLKNGNYGWISDCGHDLLVSTAATVAPRKFSNRPTDAEYIQAARIHLRRQSAFPPRWQEFNIPLLERLSGSRVRVTFTPIMKGKMKTAGGQVSFSMNSSHLDEALVQHGD